MSFYETVFIARQDLSDGQVKSLKDEVTKIIEDQGGKVYYSEDWGLRSFAYLINKSRKGHYTLLRFEGPGSSVEELERRLRLHEDVVRSLTIRQEEKSEEVSPMMEKPNAKKEAA